MFIVVIIVIIALFIVVNVLNHKLSNLRHRAEQQLLGKVGLSNANINSKFNQMQESKYLEKLLLDNPNLNENLLKETLKSYAFDLINGVSNINFSDKTNAQMNSKTILKTMSGMQFERINIVNYRNSGFASVVIFTDGRDEYQISLFCVIKPECIYVDSIDVIKGLERGF